MTNKMNSINNRINFKNSDEILTALNNAIHGSVTDLGSGVLSDELYYEMNNFNFLLEGIIKKINDNLENEELADDINLAVDKSWSNLKALIIESEKRIRDVREIVFPINLIN